MVVEGEEETVYGYCKTKGNISEVHCSSRAKHSNRNTGQDNSFTGTNPQPGSQLRVAHAFLNHKDTVEILPRENLNSG
jgi:hypothetical protein